MSAAAQNAAVLSGSNAGKWSVMLRDKVSGQLMPVMVPESVSVAAAISEAINRAARFVPGCDWEPLYGRRIK